MADIKDHVSSRGGSGGNRYYHDNADGTFAEAQAAHLYVKQGGVWVAWDGTGGGGGGGAVTVADGADVAEGSTADVAWVSGAGTMIAISKAEHAKLEAIRALLAGSLTVNVGLTDAQLRASAVPVSAPVGTPVFARLSDGAAALIGQKAMAASLPVVVASDQATFPVTATGPTLTKGTQGATGYSVQDLKDSGRVNIALTIEFAFAQTAETLLTVTESRAGAATATFTSKTITSGKRIRFTGGFAIIETLGTGTTVPQRMYLRLRVNTAGATTTASPLQYVFGLGISTGSAAIPVKSSNMAPIVIPDGVEYAGDGTATYGLTLETPDWVVTTGTGRCKITLFAFEY